MRDLLDKLKNLEESALVEAELYPDMSKNKDNELTGNIQLNLPKKIAQIPTHTIYSAKSYSDALQRLDLDENDAFFTVNKNTNQIDMVVDGTLSKKKNSWVFKINSLKGRNGTILKAYQFYRLILTNMNVIFVSDSQSYGGMRTWQELAKFPDIEVFGWANNKAVNIDPQDEFETHASDRETDDYSSKENFDIGYSTTEKEAAEIQKMKLVAHKKIR